MTSFYYYDQNPSGFCFLVLIRAFVIQTSLGLKNLNMKGKTKRIPVVVVKWRHRTNGLFAICFLEYIDLVDFSLTTFSHVLLLLLIFLVVVFVVVSVLCFLLVFCLIHVNIVTLALFFSLYNYFSLGLLFMPASLTWQWPIRKHLFS